MRAIRPGTNARVAANTFSSTNTEQYHMHTSLTAVLLSAAVKVPALGADKWKASGAVELQGNLAPCTVANICSTGAVCRDTFLTLKDYIK